MEKQWRKSGCLKSGRDVTWRKKKIFNVSFLHDGRAGSPLQRASCSRETCSPDLGQKAGYQASGPAISPCAPPRRTHTSMVKLLLFCSLLLITCVSPVRVSRQRPQRARRTRSFGEPTTRLSDWGGRTGAGLSLSSSSGEGGVVSGGGWGGVEGMGGGGGEDSPLRPEDLLGWDWPGQVSAARTGAGPPSCVQRVGGEQQQQQQRSFGRWSAAERAAWRREPVWAPDSSKNPTWSSASALTRTLAQSNTDHAHAPSADCPARIS